MAECRYKGRCIIKRNTKFNFCLPCVGDGSEACDWYEPMPDVNALLALADEMTVEKGDIWGWSRRLREALGCVLE